MGRLGERYTLVSANLTFKQAATVFAKIMGTKPPMFEIPGWFLVAAGTFCENVLPALPNWQIGKFVISKAINPPLTRQQTWLSQHKIFLARKRLPTN